ncbi:MAG: protein kinase [Acidobacteriota bacterium]
MNPALSPGTRLGRYEIRSKIGEGGMGEVYLAQDTELERTVALKVLPADVAADQQRMNRFVQEAKAASALNHPNILTIHEIGRTDVIRFIATEFIDGETLRQRMQNGPLKLREVLDIGVQITSALSAAHAAGIIHRDIKPENIMLRRDGIVKVLDFGLAKLTAPESTALEAEAATKMLFKTDPGTVMGTALYMSPEQARGSGVDARTDIFSLGVLLYELVAGRLPFDGSTSSEVLAAILNEKEPQPLARYSREVPAELERIVAKAVRKERGQRYQTTKDLLLDLQSLKQQLEFEAKLERSAAPDAQRYVGPVPRGGGQTVDTMVSGPHRAKVSAARPATSAEYVVNKIKRYKLAALVALLVVAVVATGLGLYWQSRNTQVAIESIVVLPFVNQNNDPNTDYLSDGLTESIINSLTQLPNLKVIARSSAFHYKGKEADPFVAGKELGVRAVLTGRLQQRGDNLLVSAELMDVRDNKQLWGDHYNRKLVDILTLQEEIARQISENLRLRLGGEEQKLLTKRYTENTEAYQLYLKGRYFLNRKTEADAKRAIDYFQQALAKDSNDALAYAGLADSYSSFIFPLGVAAPREAMPRAKEAAMHALAIDNSLGEAHASLAYITFFYDWDWPAAEREFKRAIELNPNNADAHHWYSHYLMAQGRIEESLIHSKRALELSPFDILFNIHLGWHYLYAHQYDQALDQIEKTVEMDKNFAQTYPWLGLILEQKGRYPEAIAAFQNAIRLFPGGSSIAEAELAHTYAVSGNREEAQKIIAELQQLAKSKYVSSYQMAAIYAGLSEKDRAFAWLEKAHEERSDGLVNLTAEQRFDSLRSDPRFTDLVRRVGLP